MCGTWKQPRVYPEPVSTVLKLIVACCINLAVISSPSLCNCRRWAAQSNKIANNQHLPLRNDDQKSSTQTATSHGADRKRSYSNVPMDATSSCRIVPSDQSSCRIVPIDQSLCRFMPTDTSLCRSAYHYADVGACVEKSNGTTRQMGTLVRVKTGKRGASPLSRPPFESCFLAFLMALEKGALVFRTK